MKRLALACALGLLAAPLAGPAKAQTVAAGDALFRATTLNVSAYGETKAVPDKATITLGVTNEAPTAQAAMQANAAEMNRVVAALKRSGLSDREIQTARLSLNPQYVYQENLPPKLTGYQASNQVVITLRDMGRLGAVLDAAVASGANQVQGIGFSLEDPTAAENAAREGAVKALEAKAALYARATGHRVARLVSLSEGGGYTAPPPMPMMAMVKREAMDAGSPIAPGELNVRVDVSAVYELAR